MGTSIGVNQFRSRPLQFWIWDLSDKYECVLFLFSFFDFANKRKYGVYSLCFDYDVEHPPLSIKVGPGKRITKIF